MISNKPYSESCDQNRQPILRVLKQYLGDTRKLLEIGSGTGQHAVYFAPSFPDLNWQPSDRIDALAGIRMWVAESAAPNIAPVLELDVKTDWPTPAYDAVFSANTAHIMDWIGVQAMFTGAGQVLNPGGVFLLYGPFNYAGKYTSESNKSFDAWLHQRDPDSGIRDFDALQGLALANGLQFIDDHEMPVNNRILAWRKK